MSKEGLTLGGDFPPNDHSMAFGEVERHGLALHELKTLVVGGIDAVNQAAADEWRNRFPNVVPTYLEPEWLYF